LLLSFLHGVSSNATHDETWLDLIRLLLEEEEPFCRLPIPVSHRALHTSRAQRNLHALLCHVGGIQSSQTSVVINLGSLNFCEFLKENPRSWQVLVVMNNKQIKAVLDGPGTAEEKLANIRSILAESSTGKSRERIAMMSSEVRDDNPYR
jgi:hypothetical protein